MRNAWWNVAVAVAVAGVGIGAGCRNAPGTTPSPKASGPVNAQMADFFAMAAHSAKTNPTMARMQLDEAQKVDPENGYIDYLLAAVASYEGKSDAARQSMEKGNAKKRFVQYVDLAPPIGTMPTLPLFRDLGRSARLVTKMPKDDALAYLSALRGMGKQVAGSEPLTAVGFLVGTWVIGNVERERVGFLRTKGTPAEAAAATESQAKYAVWEQAAREKLRALGQERVGQDVMNRAADRAKLNDEEKKKWLRGEAISEDAQKRVDAAITEQFKEEQDLVRELLASMP